MSVHVIEADCLEAMRAMPSGFLDSVVTDPPYGLSFMGKGWDRSVPGPEYWVEALRLVKPGARLIAFGGTRTAHRLASAIEDAGWEIVDCLSWLYGQGMPKAKSMLKPAWEPAYLARAPGPVMPLEIDACRIGTETRVNAASRPNNSQTTVGAYAGKPAKVVSGRWPANVILDEAATEVLDAQSGILHSGKAHTLRRNGSRSSGFTRGDQVAEGATYGGSGGASRFFYCAKASKSERGEGNNHPTVKPRSLMAWCVRLVTPPGGIVLDPFAGSGTTGLGAIDAGARAILIERDPAYAEIVRRRVVS